MSTPYTFTFSAIELAVRYGDGEADDPNTISCYVHLALERAKKLTTLVDVRTAHMRIVDTLIDTMCDSCIPKNWRKQCYRYLKKLMPLLFEMLDKNEYQQKVTEISQLYVYFVEQVDIEQTRTP